jgi:signal transduction histidine kinase
MTEAILVAEGVRKTSVEAAQAIRAPNAQARKERLRIVGISVLALVLIATAIGVTIWRYELALSDSSRATDEHIETQQVQSLLTVFWHEREAINEYVIAPSPTILREVERLGSQFATLRVATTSKEGSSQVKEALTANRDLLAAFRSHRGVAAEGPLEQRLFNPSLHQGELRVLGPLQKLKRQAQAQAIAREASARSASNGALAAAVLSGILGFAAAFAFVLYARRLVMTILRRETRLGEALVALQTSDAELRHTETQLYESQKMDAIGRLAGGIAHDFNNLLVAIRGYGEFLKAGVQERQLKEFAEQILKAADSAAGLTQQLLAFGGRQLHQPQVIDLNLEVREVETMLRRLIEADIRIELDLDADLDSIKADPGQINQVLINLAINARDAMSGSGTLTIATANQDDHVVLRVCDDGAGMDEETLTLALEPFFTTKAPGKGTGLGLASAHGIITQSGGTITLESELGRGTTITVRFPAVSEAAQADRGTAAPQPPQRGHESILLVEDNTETRVVVARMLRSYGYHVTHTDSPLKALEFPASCDLLLTDVVMPELDGVELTRRLRPANVLFMSGYDRQALRGEHVAYIQKPFTSEALASSVRAVLDQHQTTIGQGHTQPGIHDRSFPSHHLIR